MYQLVNENVVKRVSDGAFIPCDPNNYDYQMYLAWIDNGNKPLPAQ